MRPITVLEEVSSAMTHATRLADRIPHLCSQGEPVERPVAELADQVARLGALIASGGPEVGRTTGPGVRELGRRLAAATQVVEAKKAAVAAELEALAQRDRVRRTYQRPPD